METETEEANISGRMSFCDNPQQVVLAWCDNILSLNGGRRADTLSAVSSAHEQVKGALLELGNVLSAIN